MRSLHIKRAVAFLLLFALLIGVMPVSAFAEDTDHPVEAVITEVNETAEATTEPPVDDTSETPATETSDPIETAPAEAEIPDGSIPVESDPDEEPATEAQESADVTDQNDIPAETDPEQSKVPEETVDVPAETEQPEEIDAVEEQAEPVKPSDNNETANAEPAEDQIPTDLEEIEEQAEIEIQPTSKKEASKLWPNAEVFVYTLPDSRATVHIYRDSFLDVYFKQGYKSGNFPWTATAYLTGNPLSPVGGQWAYCIDYGTPAVAGNYNSVSLEDVALWKNKSAAQKLGVLLAVSNGADANGGYLDWIATQVVVWEYMAGRTSASQNYSMGFSFYSDGNYSNPRSDILNKRTALLNKIKQHETNIKLAGATTSGTTQTVTLSFNGVGSNYAQEITDQNGVVGNGDWKLDVPEGVHAEISNGKIIVYPTAVFTGEKTITVDRKVSGNAYAFAANQWLITGHPKNPYKFKIKLTVNPRKSFTLIKKSADLSAAMQACIKDNPLYTLKGAQYGVYTDSACNNLVETLTTDANGKVTTTKVWPVGTTLYVKEIKAPSGYLDDEAKHELTVKETDSQNVLVVSDKPTFDPSSVKLTKEGANNIKIKGAVFQVQYFASTWGDDNKLMRTWYFESDANGKVEFNSAHIASGYHSDDLYDPYGTGRMQFPIGCVVVREIKAAQGYVLPTGNDARVFLFVTQGGGKDSIPGKPAECYWGDGHGDPLENGAAFGIYKLTNTDDGTGASMVAENTSAAAIGTSAKFADGTKTTEPVGSISIVDTVSYQNLVSGKKYIMVGKLMKKNGTEFKVNNTAVTAQKEFTPNAANGSVNLTFTFNAFKGMPTDLVVFENCYITSVSDGNLVASHADKDDADQTVHFINPTIETLAYENETVSRYVDVSTSTTILDRVTYTGLIPGHNYVVVGTVMLRDGNNATPLLINGQPVTVQKSFTPEKANDKLWVSVKFDSTGLKGKTVVFFERCYLKSVSDKNLLAEHTDILDENQSVKFSNPKVSTSAANPETNTREFSPLDTVTLEDTVTYKDVIPGRSYHVTGVLMDKATQQPLKQNGHNITGSADFDAAQANGKVKVTFTFNASLVRGKELVVFETLYAKNGTTVLAEHKDINDANQTVKIVDPTVKTEAYNKDDISKGKNLDPTAVTVSDEVTCKNLIVNTQYVLKGVLMDKATGKKVLVNGEPVVSNITFTASAKNEKKVIDFTFDASGLENRDLVVFETLTQKGQKIAEHADINSEAQTVHVNNPGIGTTAKFADDNSKVYDALSKVELKDTVAYTELVAGKTYVMVGTVMVRNGDEASPLMNNGKPVTAIKEFTPNAANGSVDIIFEFDASAIDGATLVVFEELYTKADYDAHRTSITDHKDINDEGQTVQIGNIVIGTTATSDLGGKTISPAPGQKIIDRVHYTGATVGKVYKFSGILMRRMPNGSAEEVKVNGKTITAEKTFTAETSEGDVALTFNLDATGMEDYIIVVYEKMYRIKDNEEYPVAEHEDINDEAQAVSTPRPEIHTTAKNKEDGSKIFDPLEEVTLTDTVTYKNLVPGTKYVLKGKLVGKRTEEDGSVVEFEITSGDELITATKSFTAESENGEIDIDFTFSGLDMKGYEVVAYEYLYIEGNDNPVTKHEDINDENQTVKFTDIVIETNASSDDDKPVVDPLDKVTIIDTVTYHGLIPHKEYTINGVLMVKSTGMPLIDNGETVTASVTFSPEESDGSIDLAFTFNASALRGDAVVAFEALYREDIELATHSDITDQDQTVEVKNPIIGTTASNLDDGEKIVDPLTVISLEDVVEYKNLIPKHEYTIKGILMERVEDEDGNVTETVFLADGEPVTAETTFVPETENGEVSVVFTFTGLNLRGNVIVAYESLYSTEQPEKPIAEHKDINDEDQTVDITDIIIGTEARIGEDDGKVADPLESVTVIDKVNYSGLIVGKTYTITGVLMVKETGMPLLDAEGQPVSATVTFDAETSDGSIELTFEFDARLLHGVELVAFESLSREDVELAVHADLEDEAQTVEIANPIIHTTATDENGAKVYEIGEEATIYDVVSYENLIPGHRYVLIGFVMDANEGDVLVIDGEPVGQIADFVPEEANGEYLMTFTFSSIDLRGKKLVVFESLLRVTEEDEEGNIVNAEQIYDHHDLEDLAQTVYFTNPTIGTTATNKEDGSHVAEAIKTVTIVDRVEYADLIPGKTYTVNGVLYEKVVDEEGNVKEVELKVNGESVTATAEFVAENSEGYVDLEFTFSGLDMAGRTVVAFETLYCGDIELAVHADINDENQTVTFPSPMIGTKATVNGGKKAEVAKSVTVVDTVSYKGLVPGKEYTLKGILMSKETGKPLLVNGKEVTAEAKFVPTAEEGAAEMKFVFDASDLENKEVVVFEEVYRAETLIAEHKDIEDKDQTVSFYKTYSPPTGDETNLPLWIALAALSAAALVTLGAVTILKLRKKENEI